MTKATPSLENTTFSAFLHFYCFTATAPFRRGRFFGVYGAAAGASSGVSGARSAGLCCSPLTISSTRLSMTLWTYWLYPPASFCSQSSWVSASRRLRAPQSVPPPEWTGLPSARARTASSWVALSVSSPT